MPSPVPRMTCSVVDQEHMFQTLEAGTTFSLLQEAVPVIHTENEQVKATST